MPDVNKVFAGMIALGRVGVPEDIGPMIASLLGEDNRWITAGRIEASGGQVICLRSGGAGASPGVCLALASWHRTCPAKGRASPVLSGLLVDPDTAAVRP